MTESEISTIKDRIDRILLGSEHFAGKTILVEDISILLGQALLVEQLKKQNRTLNKKNHRLWKVNQELTADRDELRRRYESNRQTYINVQKGHASKRRKKRG